MLVVILAKFHDNRVKILDSLFIASFRPSSKFHASPSIGIHSFLYRYEIMKGTYKINCPATKCLLNGTFLLEEIENIAGEYFFKKHLSFRQNLEIGKPNFQFKISPLDGLRGYSKLRLQ